jgi:hypothetical protein
MGGHLHAARSWMLSYRYERMRMDGNRDGRKQLSPDEVLALGYGAVPLDMTMEMHMFGVMYAPADWLTLAAMLPYVRLEMDHVNGAGISFTTRSDGIGDLRLAGLLRIWRRGTHHLHLNAGLGIPTGRIRHKDDVPQPGGGRGRITLPFPMQIGSGTWDLMPGLTYTGHGRALSWGAQARGRVRLGENDAGWTAGDRADVTAWFSWPWTRRVGSSLRVAYHWWDDHHGDEDRPPPPSAIPTADPDLRGGQSVELLGGLEVHLPLGLPGEHRLALEFGGPVYRNLNGPQLESDWHLVAGWQVGF